MATEGLNATSRMDLAGLTYLIDWHCDSERFSVQGFGMKARLWSETVSSSQVSRAKVSKSPDMSQSGLAFCLSISFLFEPRQVSHDA